MTDEKKFAGFEKPEENWSKLPHALIGELKNITSESELKVILYILRHTWGYHDSEKRITIDEFCDGRKRSDGSRIDTGCGISSNSVKAGIAKAVEHGYINVEEDARDKARIKRWYSIASRKEEADTLHSSRGSKVDPLPSKFDPLLSNFDPRTEKDTPERYSEKGGGSRVRENGSAQSETTTPLKSKERTVVAPYPALGELSNTGTAGQWADARGQAQAAAPGYVREMNPVRDALLAAHHINLAALEDAALRSKWMKQTIRFWEAGLNSVAAVQALARRWSTENPFGQKGQAPAGDQLLTFHFSGLQPSAPTAPDGTPTPAYRPVLTDDWSA